MQIQGFGRTHCGRRRENNEDAYFTDDTLGCYIVCDGVGGHAGGEIASAMAIAAAVEVVRERTALLARVAQDAEPASALETVVRDAALAACTAVHAAAQADAHLTGMATTLTMLCTAGHFAAVAHVGDSRCYLVRDGAVSQLSTDHTYAEELRAAGGWTDEQIAKSPFGSALSRAVGMEAVVHADTLTLELAIGDRFVLCSDGLSRYLSAPAELSDRLPTESAAAPAALVDFANAAGGKDNITVVVVEVGGGAAPTPEVTARSTASGRRLNLLAGVALFRGLRLPVHARILAACRKRSAAAGTVLWKPGDLRDSLVMLVDGNLELRDAEGGRVEILDPGDAIGEDRLLLPGPARLQATARTDLRWIELTRDGLWDLARLRPRLGLVLSRRLGERTAGRLRRWQDRVRSESREIWESTRLLDLV